MVRRPDLPSCRLLAAKHHTSRRCFRDQSVLLVGYVAFNVADGAATLYNGSFRSELCLPDRAKEIDFQFDSSEGFLRRKGACKRHPHCRIGNITKNSAVQRSHGICMLRSGCQYDRGALISDLLCFKSDQTRDGHVVDPRSLPKSEFQPEFLEHSRIASSTFRFSRTYLGFEVLLEMIAGEIERLFVSLQTSHHEAAFERTGNQCSQFQGIDVRDDLASASALLRNQLETIKPRTEGLPGFRSQLRIAIVGIYGGVQ